MTTPTQNPVRTERHGDVLVIISDSPPVNALGAAVRNGLEAGIKEGVGDGSITAMVLRCDGRTFFAGADITEFGKPMQGVGLHEVIDMMDASSKPIVAAIHGTALGGGCEVALACQYRVAVPSAKIGLPEVKLGLLPGAGGTQRLPRVVGVKAALEMIALGDPVSAKKAAEIGLVDKVVGEDSLEADAIAFAREIADKRPIPRVRDRDVAPDPEAVEAFNKRLHAIASAHQVLLQRSWSGASLQAVVETMIGTFDMEERFDVSGPPVDLSARATLSLSLLLHELATNALKYGSLSSQAGRTAIDWRIEPAGGGSELVLEWRESGGPAPSGPPGRGFGSRLIAMGLAGTGGSEVRYPAEGFSATFRAPVSQVMEA